MKTKTYRLAYDTEFIAQLKYIERKYHSVVKAAIENSLLNEPDKQSRNRKLLKRPAEWGARWELRCGENNEFRVFYSVYPDQNEVHILAVGIKVREQLYIYGKEVEL
jgi:mRNA-degrading endonuclease RelE of RelBE toxin-antitoxin system